MADRTATGYSDVDLAYFPPDDEFIFSNKKLRGAIRTTTRYILLFDHLQHHGIFVIPETIARTCSPLPPSAFHGAVVLAGKNEITLGGWEMSWKKDMEPILEKCIKLASDPKARPKNLYGIKLFLSQLMLLPALFLSARGEDVPKPVAIEKVEWMFPEERIALRIATRIRRFWVRPSRKFHGIGALWLSPWDFAFAFRRFIMPGPDILSALDEEFYQAAGRLARRMKDALGG